MTEPRGRGIPASLIGHPTATCGGCGGYVEQYDPIAYYPQAPRGMRVWHPSCVGADAATLGAARLVAIAEKAARQAAMAKGREDYAQAEQARKQALRDAVHAVIGWLRQPEMERVRALVVEHLTTPPKVRDPIFAPRERPTLRVVGGQE